MTKRSWPRSVRPLAPVLFPVVFGAVGLLLAFRPVLQSGFARTPGDSGDARFNQYLLEHSWRWLRGDELDRDFWNPPFFYPAPDVVAYSDLLLGAAPLYWPWRAAGVGADPAFRLWLLTCAVLNFGAACWLFRRGFGVGPFAAALGAYLFAFGSPRVAQLNHPQLLPAFYSVAAVAALLGMFGARGREAGRRPALWVAGFFAAVVAQLYAGFYLGWYLVFGLAVAAVWAVAFAVPRAAMWAVARRRWRAIIVSATAAGLALAPLVSHYLAVAHELGTRRYANVEPMLPRFQSWLYVGGTSWLYGWETRLAMFGAPLPNAGEHQIGIGVATGAAAFLGLWGARRRWVPRLLLLTAATTAALATLYPGNVSPWQLVFAVVPGADAIRALVRVGLPLLLPAALGVALQAERLRQRWPRWVVAALAVAVVAEQGRTVPSWDAGVVRARVARLEAAIPADCAAFVYARVGQRPPGAWVDDQIDAMWAGLERGVPTLNGYSGNEPVGWDLRHTAIRNPADERRLVRALANWEARRGLDPARVCVVRLSVGGPAGAGSAAATGNTVGRRSSGARSPRPDWPTACGSNSATRATPRSPTATTWSRHCGRCGAWRAGTARCSSAARRASDQFMGEDTTRDVERQFSGFSVLHRLPVAMADQPSAGTGTVMRPATPRRDAGEAGCRDTELLPSDDDWSAFSRLRP